MQEVICEVTGRLGQIILNRPQALNALNHAMCLQISAQLRLWANAPTVEVISLQGTGAKAFCAGGDVAAVQRALQAGDQRQACRFWADEYRMNALIAGFAKPIVSLMQGHTLGGGVGLGCHARHRFICESTQIAMPECAIGLVPDVGGSLLLAQAPGALGGYLALTGHRLRGADILFAGFADHFLPEASWPEAITILAETGLPEQILPLVKEAPKGGHLAAQMPKINHLFAGFTVEPILSRLLDAGEALLFDTIRKASPVSLRASLIMLERLQGSRDLQAALAQEYRFTARAGESDFPEGVRALLIDKDRAPVWRVSPDAAEALLASLGSEELSFAPEG